MLKCWSIDPDERPPFSDLARSISEFAEMTAGYLDMTNYNPFANEESSSDHVPLKTIEGEDCEVHSKGAHGSHRDAHLCSNTYALPGLDLPSSEFITAHI